MKYCFIFHSHSHEYEKGSISQKHLISTTTTNRQITDTGLGNIALGERHQLTAMHDHLPQVDSRYSMRL